MTNVSKRPKQTPPDGGWGWMVAGGAFLCTMMVSIPAITFGVLLNDVIFAMDTSTATATWTMSILLGLSGVISPLVTIAIHTFSCRKTAIFGGVILSVGLMLSSYATNIQTLFLTFGVMGAIGFGCNRVVAIVILGQYFKRRYGISAGLMMAGFSTSRLLFSTIVLWTKINYGFRGAYLLMGAICMHVCVGAGLYQPAKWHYIERPYQVEEASSDEKSVCQLNQITPLATTENLNKEQIKELDATRLPQQQQQQQQQQTLTLNVKEQMCDKSETSKVPVKTSSVADRQMSLIVKTFKEVLQFSLLRDPCFHVSLVSQVLFQFVILYSMVFLVPLSMDKGFQPLDAALVQTVKSCAEVSGRIGIPWILKVTNTNNIWTHIVINVANGFALVAHALVEDYNIFLVTAVITGLLSGGIVVQGYHLILITLGKEKFSAAIGLCSFMHGIFLFLGGPLLGLIRDRTGSLVNSYLLLACLQFASGLVWISRLITIRRNKKRCSDVKKDIIM